MLQIKSILLRFFAWSSSSIYSLKSIKKSMCQSIEGSRWIQL